MFHQIIVRRSTFHCCSFLLLIFYFIFNFFLLFIYLFHWTCLWDPKNIIIIIALGLIRITAIICCKGYRPTGLATGNPQLSQSNVGLYLLYAKEAGIDGWTRESWRCGFCAVRTCVKMKAGQQCADVPYPTQSSGSLQMVGQRGRVPSLLWSQPQRCLITNRLTCFSLKRKFNRFSTENNDERRWGEREKKYNGCPFSQPFFLSFFLSYNLRPPCRRGLEYADCIPCRGSQPL